jgi:uncharacterized protein YbaP (TraB family)
VTGLRGDVRLATPARPLSHPAVLTLLGPWILLGLLFGSWPTLAFDGAAPGRPPPPGYAALPGARAMAVPAGNPDAAPAVSHSHGNDLDAAASALEDCRRIHGAGAVCELLWLNDERITTGAEIRGRVPVGPHPLFLWRYRSAIATVDLAGSIHMLKPTVYPLPAAFNAAFEAADYLVLEVDLSRYAPAELERQMAVHALLPDGQAFADQVPEPQLARSRVAMARHGLDPAQLASASPALVAQQLMFARLLALGYEPATGVEQHLLARRGTRTVLELESLETQLELLFGQPLPTQLEILEDVLTHEALIEPLVADLITAWLAGDDAGLETALAGEGETSVLLDAFQQDLLDARNIAMAERIAGFLLRPGHYLVIVGAAHLIGPQGIPALLTARGIGGQRILSDQTLQ